MANLKIVSRKTKLTALLLSVSLSNGFVNTGHCTVTLTPTKRAHEKEIPRDHTPARHMESSEWNNITVRSSAENTPTRKQRGNSVEGNNSSSLKRIPFTPRPSSRAAVNFSKKNTPAKVDESSSESDSDTAEITPSRVAVDIPSRDRTEYEPYIATISSPCRSVLDSLPTDSLDIYNPCTSILVEVPDDLMSKKERLIKEKTSFLSRYMINPKNRNVLKFGHRITCLIDINAREKRIAERIDSYEKEIDENSIKKPMVRAKLNSKRLEKIARFIWGTENALHDNSEIINLSSIIKISQFLKTSVLYIEVGTNCFSCMDIIKRGIFCKYFIEGRDYEEGESICSGVGDVFYDQIMQFDETSKLNDRWLLRTIPKICDKDTLIICHNSDLDRISSTLPFKRDIYVAKLEDSDETKATRKTISRLKYARYGKNAALFVGGCGLVGGTLFVGGAPVVSAASYIAKIAKKLICYWKDLCN